MDRSPAVSAAGFLDERWAVLVGKENHRPATSLWGRPDGSLILSSWVDNTLWVSGWQLLCVFYFIVSRELRSWEDWLLVKHPLSQPRPTRPHYQLKHSSVHASVGLLVMAVLQHRFKALEWYAALESQELAVDNEVLAFPTCWGFDLRFCPLTLALILMSTYYTLSRCWGVRAGVWEKK